MQSVLVSVPSVRVSNVDDAGGWHDESTNEMLVTVQLTAGKQRGDKTVCLKDAMGQELGSSPATAENLWRSPSGSVFLLSLAVTNPSGAKVTFILKAQDEVSCKELQRLYEEAAGATDGSLGHFDKKIDKSSADLYFHYYGMLQHQQNMLQDYIRTGTYFSAITENTADFEGKAVLDVGCGSGILSLFAAQAGARVVYAVEASNMARFARQLADANPSLGARIQIIHGKVEEMELPEKVDVLVSEPMGTLLVNERMLESYIYARDRHLKPGGAMFPRMGRIFVTAFSDHVLYAEVAGKAAFWQQPSFYGVDLTCLAPSAASGYFAQTVVDQIPPNVLVSNSAVQTFDFSTCSEGELQDFTIPLSLQVVAPCTVHGVAAWFDVLFDGSNVQRFLSTSPGLPVTHWFQLRCILEQPIEIGAAGATVSGSMRLVAHSRQSYDVHVHLLAPPAGPGLPPQQSSGTFDLKEPYYRQLVTGSNWYVGNGIDMSTQGGCEQPVGHPSSENGPTVARSRPVN